MVDKMGISFGHECHGYKLNSLNDYGFNYGPLYFQNFSQYVR